MKKISDLCWMTKMMRNCKEFKDIKNFIFATYGLYQGGQSNATLTF